MTDLIALERGLAEATEGSRILDDHIAIVLDRARLRWPNVPSSIPNYTTSVDAALTLLGEVLPGWKGGGLEWGDNEPPLANLQTCEWSREKAKSGEYKAVEAWAATPALALVLAIVRALKAQEDRT